MEVDLSNIMVVQNDTKIQQLFAKFLEPDCSPISDHYLNRLLTHLSGKDKSEENALINLPLFIEWIIQATTIWDTNSITPPPNVASFTLNLASLLCRNESKFVQMNSNDFYMKLIQVLKATKPEVLPTIKLGFIKLLSSFLEHKSGTDWLMQNNLWKTVLQLTLTNQTVYITREGQSFMSKLLEQTVDKDEAFCNDVVKKILLPLEESCQKSATNGQLSEFSEEMVHKNLSPSLLLIGEILQYFLESSTFAQKDHKVALMFLKDGHLELKICNYMSIAQNRFLIFDLGKIMFLIQFVELYVNVVTNNVKMSEVQTSIRKILSVFNTNIAKGNYENVLKFCYFGQMYWNLMGYKVPCIQTNKENETICFANQLVVMQLLPIFCIAMRYCIDMELFFEDDFRNDYVQKLFKMMCEHTTRLSFSWRDFLLNQPNIFEIATKSLTYLMKSRKYYPRARAATVFQCFIYCLKDINQTLKERPEKLEFFAREVPFLTFLLDAVAVFIEEFQITWRDSVETICVTAVSHDFLAIPTWDSKLVVKALKLVNISIAKHMSPNLALLVDRTNDSTLALMGPLLYAKLHDGEWEVRDTAMEVICTISRLAGTKFEAQLVDNPLFTNWLTQAISIWKEHNIQPSMNIAIFTINLAALLSKNEYKFAQLQNFHTIYNMLNILMPQHSEVVPAIKLGFVKLLTSCLAHKSGLQWIVANHLWEIIFEFCIQHQRKDIAKESRIFIARFLQEIIGIDDIFCGNLIRKMVQPLSDCLYKTGNNLELNLQLIECVLDSVIKSDTFTSKDYKIAAVFLKQFYLEERCLNLTITHNSDIDFQLNKIIFTIRFLDFYLKQDFHQVEKFIIKIMDFLNEIMVKGHLESVMDLCFRSQVYWYFMSSKNGRHEDDESFSTKLLVLQVVPLFCVSIKYCYTKSELQEGTWCDAFRNDLMQKCIYTVRPNAIRFTYFWRTCLLEQDNLTEFATKAAEYILKSCRYYNKTQGSMILQTCLYSLKDIMQGIRADANRLRIFYKEDVLISNLFEILSVVVNEFQITWVDTIESVDVISVTINFVTFVSWPVLVVVEALKLVAVAMVKGMAPNLILLMDDDSDSLMPLLKQLLCHKLSDGVSQVRQAAMEVVYAISDVLKGRK